MPYTLTSDPEVERMIAGHMHHICQEIVSRLGDRISCIALTGGFGRGEGGAAPDAHGRLYPVNDYDILVVCRRDDLLTWWKVRRELKRLEPALSRHCGLRVDLACKTPRMLASAPLSVEAYETAVGHQVLWGNGNPLAAIPWRDAGLLPPWEATRYLFNRGAALLWARMMLDEQDPLTDAGRRFICIAVQKARLSWGDAILILHRRYDAVYRRRPSLLDACPIPAELDFVRPAYLLAVRDKLMPAFPPFDGFELHELLQDTIARHERVWRWVEEQRGTGQGNLHDFWRSFFRKPTPLLRDPSAPLSAGRRFLHCAALMARLRTMSPRLWKEPLEEHLVRVLPLLLFLPAEEVPWQEVARRLGCLGWGWHRAPRQVLSRRFIRARHPGPPY